MEPAGNWTLPPDTTAPGVARRIVASALTSWRDPADVVLIASELVTNAVQHGSPPIVLGLSIAPARARVSVMNARGESATQPRIVAAGADEPDGRGLVIVAALSTEWGWKPDGDNVIVWAEVADAPRSGG
jgi:anti-sigma regulatory factor (Ser/Thr protein kinase)